MGKRICHFHLRKRTTSIYTKDKTAEFILSPTCPLFGGSTVHVQLEYMYEFQKDLNVIAVEHIPIIITYFTYHIVNNITIVLTNDYYCCQ